MPKTTKKRTRSRKVPESAMDRLVEIPKRYLSEPPPIKKVKKVTKKRVNNKIQIIDITKTNVRPILRKLAKGQLLLVARSAVEELVSRSHLKCDPALVIFSILAPENFGGE